MNELESARSQEPPKAEPRVSVPLDSERIVVQAPLSYTGSTKRLWRITEGERGSGAQVALVTLAVSLIACAWLVVTIWYLFAVLVLPVTVIYRLLRRSDRNRKVQAARHRELLQRDRA